MSRRISDQVVLMPEHDRFIRGMVAWLGFKQVAYEYDRHARFAGTTKYPLTKMVGFAADALVSFSMVPLRIATYIGALLTTVLTFVGIGAVIGWILSGTVPGWTSLTLLVVMISSVQLLVLGLIGEYVGRTYIQSKNRPLFVISHIHRRGRLPNGSPRSGEAENRAGIRCSRRCNPIWDRGTRPTPRRDRPMKAILNHPALYQAYQNAGGFFGARVKAIADYLTLRSGMRVIDIGCGPGYILRHLPPGIDYTGFDIDQAYIDHARRAFGHLGQFHCRYFDADAAREFAGADVVMMNGVLHHIADEELKATLANVRDVLKRDGVLFTLDGCYRDGQSRIAKWLLDNDRGEFVRDRDGYDRVLTGAFEKVDLTIRDDYSRLPYTFIIGISRKQRRSQSAKARAISADHSARRKMSIPSIVRSSA